MNFLLLAPLTIYSSRTQISLGVIFSDLTQDAKEILESSTKFYKIWLINKMTLPIYHEASE